MDQSTEERTQKQTWYLTVMAQWERMYYSNRATNLPNRNTENGSPPHTIGEKTIPDPLDIKENKWCIYN